jgi:hypothetical protein
VLLLFVAATLSGCGGKQGTDVSGEDRVKFVRSASEAARAVRFEHTEGQARRSVVATVEDDYRYRASLREGDRVAYEEVVVDDFRAIRLADPAVIPEPVRAAPSLAPALTGGWVEDAAKAPPEFVNPTAPLRVLDPRPVLDVVRVLDEWTSASGKRVVQRMARWDPKSSNYVFRYDKFEGHKEDGVRYDLFPTPYDADDVFDDGIPSSFPDEMLARFLYTSLWFKDGRVTRLERAFEIDTKTVARDLESAASRQAQRAGVSVKSIALPPVPAKYRESYTFAYSSADAKVVRPATVAVVALPTLASAAANAAPPAAPMPAPPNGGGPATPPTLPVPLPVPTRP